jgi:hypothetical protein
MNIIKIPVSAFSKKILIAEYPSHEPSGTILIGTRTLLQKQLTADLPYSGQNIDVLTTTIEVYTSGTPKINHDNIKMLGLMIHQEHKDSCMRWIQATVAAGQTASHGIRTFFAHYDLDDEDLNYETTFRQWQRYLRRNIDLLHKPKGQLLQPVEIQKTYKPIEENKFALFISEIVEHLYVRLGNTHRWHDKRVRALRLLVISLQNPVNIIPLEYGLTLQGMYASIQSARKWVKNNDFVLKIYLKYYGVELASLHHDKGYRRHQKSMRSKPQQ